jgi:hypothetical protein
MRSAEKNGRNSPNAGIVKGSEYFLNARCILFNSVSSLRKAIKQAKRQYRDKEESQFSDSNTRLMWQGLQ